MELSLLALIGISLAAMFFGYFFGLFEGRGQGYKKRKKEEASDPSLKPVVQAPQPPPAPPADTSLLKLSLDEREQPRLELDGQRIDTSQMDAQQRKRLINLMLVMRPWIESGPEQRAGASASAALAAEPRPTIPPPVRQVVARAAPAPAPTDAAVPATQSATAEPVSTPTTMVGQIDAILQKKLAGTPMAPRGIRLVESLKGGVTVMVGLERYEGVGEVPDPEVQAAIRAAIAEWEKKYTPG